MLSLRLTPEEYENLRASCLAHGARCLSEYARSAVLDSLRSAALAEAKLEDRLLSLERQVAALSSRLTELSGFLGKRRLTRA